MRTIHRLFATLSVAAVIAGPGAPTAQAGDYKAFPGSMCVRNSQYSGGTPYYAGSGRIFNTSSQSWLHVICPIVRDNETSSVGLQVIAIDQNLSSGVSCRGLSNSRDGTTGILGPVGTTSGNASTGKPINLGTLPSKENFGAHVLLCEIPPTGADASGVASYVTLEP
jgi:hypothetical protein